MISKIDKAKIKLVTSHVFFASLVCRHEIRETKQITAAAVTDNGVILINPDWAESRTVQELVFVLAHEVMHIVLAHRFREGNRNHELFNIAADACINYLLRNSNVGTPIDGVVLLDIVNAKSTAEEVYNWLLSHAKKVPPPSIDDLDKSVGDGGSDGSDGSSGQSKPRNTYDKDTISKAIADGKVELAEAYQSAKMQGSGGGAIAEFAEQYVNSPLPWYEILSQYVSSKREQRQSWSRPNKRYLRTAYLPSKQRLPSMGRIVVGVDTSGSISDKELAEFIGHMNKICEDCNPSSVDVLYVTSEVEQVEHYERSDLPLKASKNRWFGGTDMRKVVSWAEENNEDDIDVVITFTDGYTPFPSDSYLDTVWVINTDAEVSEAKGKVLRV